nr:Lrp/AsnC family transcriptional regulator [uncultured Kingella sp.]
MKKFDDKISQAILAKLRENSRISWQQLGEAVHLSPQACAERVRQMQDAGIISGFTLRENRPRHFITVLMAHNRFAEFERFLHAENGIESADKTHGDGCYHIVYIADTAEELEAFLTRLSAHGRYRTASSMRRVMG